jgi:hypothetical protein
MTAAEIETPPLLEQLGALGSLLVHDMANQMCIISGNATFAQMMLTDPQQVARAVDAIAKSGERMSFMLNQCADLRRRLASDLPHGAALPAVEQLRDLFNSGDAWDFAAEGDLAGELPVPIPWVLFTVRESLTELSGCRGTVRIRRVRTEEDTAFLPGGAYFEIHLRWRSSQRFSIDDIRSQYRSFGLLAAFELLRQCGGKLEGFTPAEGRQELLICIPYVVARNGRATTAGGPVIPAANRTIP